MRDAVLDHAVERLLRRDRLVVAGGLVVVVALTWAYLVLLAAQMEMPPAASRTLSATMQLQPWTASDAVLMFLMWAVMMVAMMVPSATPMILLYARVMRRQARVDDPLAPTTAFFAGYVAVWAGFSAAATALQWGLEAAALLSPMMASKSPVLGGLLLVLAGAYQWTPVKDACLKRCSSPVWFLSTHWRRGTVGAFRMGLEHGTYCLGCCWALMALLFVGGVMNLLWIGAITIFVLVEKVAVHGRLIGRAGAVALAATGTAVLAGL